MVLKREKFHILDQEEFKPNKKGNLLNDPFGWKFAGGWCGLFLWKIYCRHIRKPDTWDTLQNIHVILIFTVVISETLK